VNISDAKLGSLLSGWVARYAGVPVLVAFFALAIVSPLSTRWVDFPVYWEAGRKAIASQTVYDVVGHFQYKYSPLIALLFGKAFSSFSFETASWIFQKGMLALWALLFFRFSERRMTTVFWVLLFFGNALRLDLALGQVNALVIYLLALLFASLERSEDVGFQAPKRRLLETLLFALLFSFAVQLKLFALILVPVLLLRREWSKLALGIALLPALSIGGVALYSGVDFALAENAAWVRSLSASTDELLVDPQNVAILGTFGKLLGLTAGKALWLVAGAAFFVYLFRSRVRPVRWIRNRSFAAIAFLNPLVWSYWILFLVPLAVEIIQDRKLASADLDLRRGPRSWFHFIVILFVFGAFASQHAKWAWNGGILIGMALLTAFAQRPARKLSP
jgi:hypothetical protein